MTSWCGILMRNLDGRTGRIDHESTGFAHIALRIKLDDPADVASVWVQRNADTVDGGEICWYWNAEAGPGAPARWLLLGDHNPEGAATIEGRLPPYTPALFDALSKQAEASYEQLLIANPPGTIHGGRNLARGRMERTAACAAWMRANGHETLSHVGPYGDLPMAGSKVTVMRGSIVRASGGQKKEPVALTRRQTVTLRSVDAGWVDVSGPEATRVRQPTVRWSGTGGYWHSTDVANVEGFGLPLEASA